MMELPYSNIMKTVEAVKSNRRLYYRLAYSINCHKICKLLNKSRDFINSIKQIDILQFIDFLQSINVLCKTQYDGIEVSKCTHGYNMNIYHNERTITIMIKDRENPQFRIIDQTSSNILMRDVEELDTSDECAKIVYDTIIDTIIWYLNSGKETQEQ